MTLITQPDYQLPQIEALAYMGVFESGTTQPIKAQGVNISTGTKGQYVVKCRNANRMSAKSSCRELIGAWMAAEMDLQAAEPALVNFSQEFVQTFAGKAGYKAALQSIGYNFGTVYENGYQLVPNQQFVLENNLLEQAKRVFLFDMLIANADRGAGKPNVLSNGTKMLVFDHELAFSYLDLLSFTRNPTPWIFGHLEQEMYEQHYFYALLKGDIDGYEQQAEVLDRFNDSFWQEVYKWVPVEWQSEDLDTICTYTQSIVAHKEEFIQQFTKILAT